MFNLHAHKIYSDSVCPGCMFTRGCLQCEKQYRNAYYHFQLCNKELVFLVTAFCTIFIFRTSSILVFTFDVEYLQSLRHSTGSPLKCVYFYFRLISTFRSHLNDSSFSLFAVCCSLAFVLQHTDGKLKRNSFCLTGTVMKTWPLSDDV